MNPKFVVLSCTVGLLAGVASAQDLNLNAVEDPRDLREGTSPDCNLNGTVDERDATAPHFTQAIEHLNALEPGIQNNVWDAQPIDFNQDGFPDLVVTSMYSANVGAISYWRNEGGSALVHVNRLLIDGTRPFQIRVGDVNADGLQDFVANDSSFNQFYVFIATGPEAFADPVTYEGAETNNGASGIDLDDLDNDGDLDVAFSTWYEPQLNTFLNNGDGTFTPAANFLTDGQPRDIDIGDVNGDTLPDLAVAFQGVYGTLEHGYTGFYFADGKGGYTAGPELTLPEGNPPWDYNPKAWHVALGDVDGDDDLDVVTSALDADTLTIHLNDGAGNFTQTQHFGGFNIEGDAHDVILRDFDNDADLDIAWGDTDMHSVDIYVNDGTGTFQHHQRYGAVNYGGFELAAADFNQDGLLDIVTSNNASKSFTILPNLDGLNFDATIQLRPEDNPGRATFADFNNDGVTDLLTPGFNEVGGAVMRFYEGLGAGVFAKTPINTTISVAGRLHARDVNHDGNMDIIDLYGHSITRFGNGNGTFQPEIVSPVVSFVQHRVDDLNGDGDFDLAWLSPGHPGDIVVSFGSSDGTFGERMFYTDPAEPESIATGDITGDGFPEVFSGHRHGILSIHPNNGDGTFGERRDIVLTGGFSPIVNAIAVADFDGDGDNDVAVSAQGIKIFFNPGDGELPEVPVLVSTQSASELFPVDIDGDGTIDMYGESASAIVYLNGNGDGFFDIVMSLRRYDSNAQFIVVADVNSDGRPDVTVNPENSWGHYVFLNLPSTDTDLDGNLILDSCEVLFGDVDDNGTIDESDRTAFCLAIGTSVGEPGYLASADMNGDEHIDHLDLEIINEILPACDGDVVASDTFAPPPDGVTDGADLAYLLGEWANQPSCADFVSSKTFAPPPDGSVDGADIAFLLGAWGACD